jgi:hypothetical protein
MILDMKGNVIDWEVLFTMVLREDIESLEERNIDVRMFFKDFERDNATTEHLIHCMKVVHDYYSNTSCYFDYSEVFNEGS